MFVTVPSRLAHAMAGSEIIIFVNLVVLFPVNER